MFFVLKGKKSVLSSSSNCCLSTYNYFVCLSVQPAQTLKTLNTQNILQTKSFGSKLELQKDGQFVMWVAAADT